jgi:hypothetical protein
VPATTVSGGYPPGFGPNAGTGASRESPNFPGRTCLAPPEPFVTVDDCVLEKGNTSAGFAGCVTGVDGSGRPVVSLAELTARLADGGLSFDFNEVIGERGDVHVATGFAVAALIITLLAPLLWVAALWALGTPSTFTLWLVTAFTAGPLAIASITMLRRLDHAPIKEVVTSGATNLAIIADPPSVYLVGGPGPLVGEMVHVAGAALVAVFAPLVVAVLLDPLDAANGIVRAMELCSPSTEPLAADTTPVGGGLVEA